MNTAHVASDAGGRAIAKNLRSGCPNWVLGYYVDDCSSKNVLYYIYSPVCRTDIPMKECSAFGDVTTCDAANVGQKQREANLYEPVSQP